jgi:hypothetical protein
MDRYTDTVQNEIGNAVAGASVLILDAAGQSATLYANRAGTVPLGNPLTTDQLGAFSFFAADGVYSARVSIAGVFKAELKDIRLEDPSNGLAVYAASGGAALIGTASGSTVQADLTGLRTEVDAWEPYELPAATNAVRGGVRVGSGINLSGDLISVTPYSLPVASASILGGVKVGTGLNVAGDGTMSAVAYTLPVATGSVLGGVKAGNNVSIAADGTLTFTQYSLPIASAATLGGVRIGEGLAVDGSGILSATGLTTGSVATVNSIAPVSGNVALTTDNLPESGTPTNQWFTAARVRSAVLTGLSVATNAVVDAADTLLVALGKLQAQVTARVQKSGDSMSGKLTLPGSTSALALLLTNASEKITIAASPATGTVNFDVTTQSLLWYTQNATGNWTINVRGNASNTLNSMLGIGEAITVSFWASQGSTAYYPTAIQVDGAAPASVKWQSVAPSAGNASAIDIYTVAIVKTANATFTVFASQVPFR